MDKIRDIKRGRVDLTDFLIHFTRKTETKSAFEVLKQIISDGYIKTGWSERGTRRTVFGKSPAICFSETPLYGFVDYVNKRNEKDKIDNYGLAFTRDKLFTVGARKVIYGVTGHRPESVEADGTHLIEGFPEDEQYRYVLTTSIDGLNDWMHEREWRWTNWNGMSNIEGLPIWLNAGYEFINQIIVVIVSTIDEKSQLITHFLNLKDNINAIYGTSKEEKEYKSAGIGNIKNTCILTLEEIDFDTHPTYRIEDAIRENKIYRLRNHFAEPEE